MEVLPDDLVRECLLRVPYNSHDNLKAVCRSWEAIVSSPNFYADRKISGTSDQLLCMIQRVDGGQMIDKLVLYDPVKGTWESLPPIDDPHIAGIPLCCQCVSLNRKLVLIGGFHPSPMSTRKSVYIYDFESARWSRGTDMPTPRSSFACCVSSSNGLVYVAGGLNEDIHPLAAEAYNVEEDKWEILPPMIQPHSKGCHGVFVEGKFMVISGGEFNLSAEIFDPRAETWRRWEDVENVAFRGDPWRTCLVASSSGELYGFNKEVVKKYDGEKRLWNVVASLPQSLTQFMCAAQSRDWIFLSGFVEYRKYVSYLFHPSSGQSIKINASDGGNYKGVILSAATVEI